MVFEGAVVGSLSIAWRSGCNSNVAGSRTSVRSGVLLLGAGGERALSLA